ncbi:MAG TPA: sporulation initiation factor Spo0A C-terminal domain-containing protein [Bacillota bacterium]|jgi:hypothetical protein|nr:sporulation initiation factor Spo0A C-terminal domain-containing protein [Bacillota bacterium]
MNMKKIYKQVAKQYGVSEEEVKREIQTAIEATYAKPNFYAECVERKNEIPTPEELIKHLSNRVAALKGTDSSKK